MNDNELNEVFLYGNLRFTGLSNYLILSNTITCILSSKQFDENLFGYTYSINTIKSHHPLFFNVIVCCQFHYFHLHTILLFFLLSFVHCQLKCILMKKNDY